MSNDQGLEKLAVSATGCGKCMPVVWYSDQGQENLFDVLFANREEAVLMRVADDPRTPSLLLTALAAQKNCDIRVAVSENSSCPEPILKNLAADEDVDVRYAIAENHNMPVEILQTLATDENPHVSCRARKTLDRLADCAVLPFPVLRVTRKAN